MTGSNDTYKSYLIRRAVEPMEINSVWDKPAWEAIEPLSVELFMGSKPEHTPETQAKLAWDDQNIYVIFRVQDCYIKAVALKTFEKVYQDSCVEFFFTPNSNISTGYFNLETNCIGTALMFHQLLRFDGRRFLDETHVDSIQRATSLPKGSPIDKEITEKTTWTIEYAIPWRMLQNYTDVTAPAPGVVWRGNFYKCGDELSHPHWMTWSKIPLEEPNFHQPAYFGYLNFSE